MAGKGTRGVSTGITKDQLAKDTRYRIKRIDKELADLKSRRKRLDQKIAILDVRRKKDVKELAKLENSIKGR